MTSAFGQMKAVIMLAILWKGEDCFMFIWTIAKLIVRWFPYSTWNVFNQGIVKRKTSAISVITV